MANLEGMVSQIYMLMNRQPAMQNQLAAQQNSYGQPSQNTYSNNTSATGANWVPVPAENYPKQNGYSPWNTESVLCHFNGVSTGCTDKIATCPGAQKYVDKGLLEKDSTYHVLAGSQFIPHHWPGWDLKEKVNNYYKDHPEHRPKLQATPLIAFHNMIIEDIGLDSKFEVTVDHLVLHILTEKHDNTVEWNDEEIKVLMAKADQLRKRHVASTGKFVKVSKVYTPAARKEKSEAHVHHSTTHVASIGVDELEKLDAIPDPPKPHAKWPKNAEDETVLQALVVTLPETWVQVSSKVLASACPLFNKVLKEAYGKKPIIPDVIQVTKIQDGKAPIYQIKGILEDMDRLLVGKDMVPLRQIDCLIGNYDTPIPCILDGSSGIVGISKKCCEQIGLAYTPVNG
ncbi:hypothetical protein DACRYDRAFT_110903 [Dacryopinax primogenitus]|uniref:Uncharacterized protein n=1 Tax=Dacryopinax primogenitus (strain DJM 731) TaxID=1858805 RepID=M5FY24_DACPD|nr:uncharacterized protein DACRYDRAFT_110903 [Dacryopinax primogenitus]EJT98461.1 hypothetical protein DACRYDRAFT_110903 [Dacryopinax primogenitus]